uniref:ATP synthase subunit a n=1 Tax=Hemiodoecus leai TaxID=1254501 RepID=A0A0U1XEP6_9HEMI|nr:ATP synthase F0 subunit 6 [Hemiodoecus leai]AIS38306.1 ATP synthase F0 subunit 6 [Hemiodoecus leai]
MMTSLFSSFDPTTIFQTQLNWMSSLIVIMFMPLTYWINSPQPLMMWSLLSPWIHIELKSILSSKYSGSTLLMVSMCIFILMNNLLGLFPYIFTSSSHFSFSLSLALPSWISFMVFGWLRTTNMKFAHLVPEGTPSPPNTFHSNNWNFKNNHPASSYYPSLNNKYDSSTFFNNSTSNNFTNSNNYSITFIVLGQSFLMLFEMMVSCIQAYVFAILISLYFEE